MIKFNSYVEYLYNLSFMLFHSNEDFESINRCDSITSQYFIKEMRVRNYKRIKSEDENHVENKSDIERYYEYMILFSKQHN
ncbi:MAG: hypothetical protein IPM96_18820 [Ignavibacteria bacterium]|nr:hypothetical protein [Ignavibacteria bacterium]